MVSESVRGGTRLPTRDSCPGQGHAGRTEQGAPTRSPRGALGIVTNGVVRRQQPKIETLHIRPSLSTVVISEAVQIEKPDPRIFARALAEVGCEASQAWFVGDHPVNDVLGAAAVGCRPIWLRGFHPWPPDHPVPSWQIGALTELMELVQQERSPAT